MKSSTKRWPEIYPDAALAVRNRISVLLALIRHRVTSRDYQRVLSLHNSDGPLTGNGSGHNLENLQRALDRVFEILEKGDFSRSHLQEFVQRYESWLTAGPAIEAIQPAVDPEQPAMEGS